jgi:PST family polysaccharide transporter
VVDESTGQAPSLTARVRSAALWSFVLIAGRALIQFGLGIVLARLLGPGPFGLVAIALAFVAIGQLVVDAGAGAGLVQSPTLTEGLIRSAFTLQVTLGLLVGAAFVVSAPWISGFFDMPDLAPVMRWLAPIFVLQALGSASANLLRRNLQQRKLNTIFLCSYVIGFGLVALPMALKDLGVWALVAGQLTQTASATIALMVARPHSLRPRRPWNEPGLMRYGRTVLEVNLTNVLLENVDRLVVGKRLDAVDAGLYSRAYATARVGPDSVVSALQSALFAGVSRRQGDLKTASEVYVAALNLVSLLAMPALAMLASLAVPITHLLYGSAWEAMAPALSVLAFAMVFHVGTAVSGPMLWSLNRVRLELRAALASLAVLLSGLLVFRSGGVILVAWTVAGSYAVRSVLMIGFATRVTSTPRGMIMRSAVSGVRPALLVLATCWGFGLWLDGPGLVLVAMTVSAALVLILVRQGYPAEWSAELRGRVSQLGRIGLLIQPRVDRMAGKTT